MRNRGEWIIPAYIVCVLIYLFFCSVAQAAKVQVTWVNPSTNRNGTPLTDLSYIVIEWGSCNGVEFGVMQSSSMIATTAAGANMSSWIYPTGLAKVCVRAFAFNMKGVSSESSNVSSKSLIPKPGKPVTLDQPIILKFKEE